MAAGRPIEVRIRNAFGEIAEVLIEVFRRDETASGKLRRTSAKNMTSQIQSTIQNSNPKVIQPSLEQQEFAIQTLKRMKLRK